MSFISELKRRNVIRVAVAYVVAAWLIIQVVETISPAFGYADTFLRSVVVILAAAFIPALVFSWVFELTPEGLKREVQVDRESSITRYTGKKIDRFIMVLLALALGYFTFDKFVLDPVEDVRIAETAHEKGRAAAIIGSYGAKSIAVLPFVNMSDDPGNEYFSDGISEELLNLLAKIPELRVISRSSAFSFKGKNLKIADIARELNVVHVLEGSVRKTGNQVRITAQLIEGQTDMHLWSETYDRTLDNIFAIQDEIAAAVVKELKIKLLGEESEKYRVAPDVYEQFLLGRYLINQGTIEGNREAVEIFIAALEKEPAYAPAWSELHRAYVHQISNRQLTREAGLPIALEAIDQAIELDPDDAISLSRLGWVKMEFETDLEAAAQLHQRALALEPGNAIVLANAAALLKTLGRVQQAISVHEWVVQRDPLNPISIFNLSHAYFAGSRFDEAEAGLRKTLQLSPGYAGAPGQLARVLYNKGEFEEARQLIEKAPPSMVRVLGEALIQHATGDDEQCDTSLRTLIEDHAPMSSGAVSFLYAVRGDLDTAFEWLQTALDLRGAEVLINFRDAPEIEAARKDPRFEKMLAQHGLSEQQLSAIRLEVKMPE